MFKNFKNKNNGVTLVELMVVISIFAIISTTVLVDYRNFSSSVVTQNLADDIALSVRKAQSYAIGVRGSSGSFNQGYGIHFANSDFISGISGSNKSFVLFSDMGAQNKQYDYNNSSCGTPVEGNECMEVLSINSANEISEIVLIDNNNEKEVVPQKGVADIVFIRPNPEPVFCYRSNIQSLSCVNKKITMVKIKVSSIADPSIYRIITISNNGQISIL